MFARHLRRSPGSRILKGRENSREGGMKKFEVQEGIERIYRSLMCQAEGLLEDACAHAWPDYAVARAAHEWYSARLMLADAKRWREKVRKSDFDDIESA